MPQHVVVNPYDDDQSPAKRGAKWLAELPALPGMPGGPGGAAAPAGGPLAPSPGSVGGASQVSQSQPNLPPSSVSVDHRQLQPGLTTPEENAQFFNRLNQGDPVAGKPGWFWFHTGSGWTQTTDPSGGGPTGPEAPRAPTLGEAAEREATPNTVGGEFQRSQGPVQDAFRAALLNALNTDTNAVTLQDPSLAPAFGAFSAERQRAAQRAQEASAERLGASGLASSGARGGEGLQIDQGAGQDIAAYGAGLVRDEQAARRDLLTNAMTTAGELGMAEEQNRLALQVAIMDTNVEYARIAQTELGRYATIAIAKLDADTRLQIAELDAQLQREGYSAAERLQILDNEVRRYGIDVSGNLGVLDAMVRLIGLEQQNVQFNDQLGLDFFREINRNNNFHTLAGLRDND